MKKTILIILATIFGVIFLCVSCGLIATLAYNETYKTETNLRVDFLFPEDMKVNKEYDLKIELKNTGNKAITVKSVEFPTQVLSGIEIVNSNPEIISKDAMDIMGLQYVEHIFTPFTINAGETFTITMKIKTLSSGFYSGDYTVYLDRLYNQVETYETFTIKEL
jgi:hypothetical protein